MLSPVDNVIVRSSRFGAGAEEPRWASMHAVEIFLPLRDNNGRAFGRELYACVRRELMDRFGGLTAFSRSPAQGLWEDGGAVSKDEIVILEVMTAELDRSWWSGYRQELERRFEQEAIVIRASRIDLL